MCQVLSWALARSPGARSLACERLADFCEAGLFPALVRGDQRLARAVIALVRQNHEPGGGQRAGCAPDPGGGQVMGAARQWSGYPQDLSFGAGDDLQVHPVLTVLAGIERPVSRYPVDGDERAVQDHERVPCLRRPKRGAQLRRAGGQQADGLGHLSPGGRDP